MTGNRLGKVFGFDGEEVWIFDAEGIALTTGKFMTREEALRRRYSWRDEGEVHTAVASLQALVREAVKANGRDEPTRLQLSPRSAVLLFLAGTLTRAHLENARLMRQDTYIEIGSAIAVRGIKLTVRIYNDPDLPYNMAVTNARGNVLAQRP